MSEESSTRQQEGSPPPRGPGPRLPFSWSLPIVWVAIGLLFLWMWLDYTGLEQAKTIPYSEFRAHLAQGELRSCVVGDSDISCQLTGDDKDGKSADFRTSRIEDPGLVDALTAAKVEFSGKRPSAFPGLMTWGLPLLLVIVFWFWLLRGMRGAGAGGGFAGSAMAFGKSRAKVVAESEIQVDFSDVAGCEEAKTELLEVVDFLRDPERFKAVGAKIPHGLLLVGPPGTGKTLMARAVAGESGVPFYSLSGSDFVEMFVGVGAARVRDLFEQAKEHAPCIVFIDELDAIGRQRGVHISNVNDEREHTLNQLLVEMDGFESNAGVILLAATNRPDVLDPALLRPGRFDRQVVIDAPDAIGRLAILEVHARGKPLAPDVDLGATARATPGFSGADLANVINESALLAARRRSSTITQADLDEAVEKVVAGPERKSRRLGDEEKRRVAFHEVGHALVAAHCEHADPVRKISIVPRGRAALGYTLQLPTGDQLLMSRSELDDRLTGFMGGISAEEIVFGEISTGAENDLEQATALARRMVCQFGMGESAGLMHCAKQTPLSTDPLGALQRDFSEQTAREIDLEVKKLLEAAHDEARKILREHRDQLERIAAALLERETLDASGFEALLAEPTVRSAGARV